MWTKTKRVELEEAAAFLLQDELYNHYMLADIFWFGPAHPMVDLYHERKNGQICAVLMRLGSGFTLYAPGEFDALGAAQVMECYRFTQLAGDTAAVRAVMAYLPPPVGAKHQYFGVWHPQPPIAPPEDLALLWVDSSNIRVFVNAMARMRRDITEFTHPLSVEYTVNQCDRGSVRAVLGVAEGRIATLAMTSGELQRTAMIVSVCTHPDFRGRGYAPAVVDALCQRLRSENKQPVLFWETESAGRMYRRLGFAESGQWRVVRY